MDGDGVEYVFRLSMNDTTPNTPNPAPDNTEDG